MAEVAEAGEARALPPEEPAYGRALRTRPGAAWKWRFDVPPGYASLAPFQVTVDFTYRLGGDSSSQVQELRPVELR